MSLTASDLQQIRSIVRDEVKTAVRDEVRSSMAIFDQKLDDINGKLTALENDVKEIYDIITELQASAITDKSFQKRSIEEKLLVINAELLVTAKQAGITLPR